jgi:hypothetical protein
MERSIAGMIMIGIGLLFIVGALSNWRIVVGSGKLIPRLLGPVGAKIFMVTIGLALIVFGICLFLGLIA